MYMRYGASGLFKRFHELSALKASVGISKSACAESKEASQAA